jgi:hypothetical protein
MSIEEPSADVLEYSQSDVLDQHVDTVFLSLAIVDDRVVQFAEVVQRELVHRVD